MNLRIQMGGLLALVWAGAAMLVRAELTVFAAASTTEVIKELVEKYEAAGGEPVRMNFASSGALARQIQGGAPADLFLSANQKWMDALAGQFIDEATRVDLLKNHLVLIAPKGQVVDLGRAFDGRLVVGDIRSVPAGMYAKEALEHAGLFDTLRSRLVMASSVRGALMFVERGEVDAGIVYATDAQCSERVEVVSVFPEESHSPILYPAAVCRSSKQPELAQAFLGFLQSSAAGAIFERYGFIVGQGCRSFQSLPRDNEASLSSFESLYPESLCLPRNQEYTRSRIREACPTIRKSLE